MVQLEFLTELFEESHKRGIHTCLDTSGTMFQPDNPEYLEKVDKLLEVNKSRFVLAVAAAKRAHELEEGQEPLNKNKVKQFYKCSFELGKDLWDIYPQFGLVNGNTVGLRAISDKDDSIEDFFKRYGKEIHWNPEEHQRIIDLVNWAKETNIINYTISKFVRNHKWEELEALKNGDTGYNYDVVKLL